MTDTQVRTESDVAAAEPSAADLMILAANQRPATITAISSLAEDMVFAAGLPGLTDDPTKLALFSNPFNGGLEEFLYVDAAQDLWHAWRAAGRHAQAETQAQSGWRLSKITGAITGVKVAVHPNGTVYAFATTTTQVGNDVPGPLTVWELAVQPIQLANPLWEEITVDLPDEVSHVNSIHVYYLLDRPSSVAVHVIQQTTAETRAYLIAGSRLNRSGPWSYEHSLHIDPAHVAGLIGIGWEPSQDISVYYATDDFDLWLGCGKNDEATYKRLTPGSHVVFDKRFGAVFATPSGVGALADQLGPTMVIPYPDGTTGGGALLQRVTTPSDWSTHTVRVWQDSAGLLHLYFKMLPPHDELGVLHQLDWHPVDGSPVPVIDWDTNPEFENQTIVRALQGNVGQFFLDAYPDNMPNQLVVHKDVPDGESAVLYMQQFGTSYWERETIRAVLEDPTKVVPYTRARYQSRVTVANGYGGPVPGCHVIVTADAPVDLEVRGAFYRVRPDLPATLTTDPSGTVTLKVLATGLNTPNLHLTVPGVTMSATVQPAAPVHRFLGGAGTLPGHPDGFTASTLTDAKNSAGDWMFPVLHRDQEGDGWPPSAELVVDWCKAAFAVSAGDALPSSMTSALSSDESVLAFSLQTHDRSRPALEVISDQQALAEHRARLPQVRPGYTTEWFGDLIEGLCSGVVGVQEVVVHAAQATLEVLVDFKDGTTAWLWGVWDDAVSAGNCVMAILAALGAKVAEVIDWLSWPFGFADVWATKKALDAEFENLVTNLKKATAWMRTASEGWTDTAEAAIQRSMASLAEVFGEQYTSRFESPGPHPTMQTPLAGLGVTDLLRSAPTNWLMELLMAAGYEDTADFPDNPFDDAMAKIAALPEWALLDPVLQKATKGMYDLFDWSNPNTAKTILVQALLEVLEQLAVGSIKLAGAALGILLDFLDAVVDQLTTWAAVPVGSATLQQVYRYIQQQAGVQEIEVLTFGDIGILMGAYPATVMYKIAFGVAPFEPGAASMSELTVPERRGEGLGGSEPPAKWESLKLFQGYFVVMMNADGPFDIQVNNIELAKALNLEFWDPPKPYWVAWAFNHFLAYGIGDYPPFWGNDFPPTDGSDPSKFGPTASWVMSAIANVADLGCACKWGTFVVILEDNPTGPNIYFALGTARIVLSGLRYDYGHDKGYPFAIWNCAINVTSFQSAATGFLRQALKEQKTKPDFPFWCGVVAAKSYVDFMCDEFAGGASLVQIIYEDRTRPTIAPLEIPEATVGEPWELVLTGVDGMTPYSWSFTRPTTPPQGTIPGRPASLRNLEQLPEAESTRMFGTPVKGEEGTYTFYVRLTDDYGPGFSYKKDDLVYLKVNPAPS